MDGDGLGGLSCVFHTQRFKGLCLINMWLDKRKDDS
jgi:hypothetical protein